MYVAVTGRKQTLSVGGVIDIQTAITKYSSYGSEIYCAYNS